MSLAASSIVLAHPSAAQAETLREMTVAAGNAAFLEKEFTDLKYAGVKTVVPGLAATEPGSDPVEAVRVTYDADKISHETLMRTYWQHADPVNPNGSFKESGARFKGAVWVADPAERAEVETNRARLERSGIFGSDGTSKKSPRAFVNVPVLDAPPASFEPFVDSFIAGAAEGGTNLTRSEAQCAIRALETDGDEEEILACLSDETLDSIEDPTIGLLSDQCRRGNNQACDELYRSAPEGSDVSIYGMTCANRLPEGAGFTCFDELG